MAEGVRIHRCGHEMVWLGVALWPRCNQDTCLSVGRVYCVSHWSCVLPSSLVMCPAKRGMFMRMVIRISFLIRYKDIVAANASGQLWLILDSMVLDVKVGLGQGRLRSR